MKTTTWLIFGAILCAACSLASCQLADSGYPMNRANPERNNHINRPALCPNVAYGRTTVYHDKWQSNPSLTFRSWATPVLDANNKLYVRDTAAGRLMQYDLTTMTSSLNYLIGDAVPTITTSGKVYVSDALKTAALSPTTLLELAAASVNALGDGTSSMAPSGEYLIRTNIGLSSTANQVAIAYFSANTNTWGFPSYTPVAGAPREALVYNDGLTDSIIVVGKQPTGEIIIRHPSYTKIFGPVSIDLGEQDPFIADDQLYVFLTNSTMMIIDPATGVPQSLLMLDLFGPSVYLKNVLIKNSKALASLQVLATSEYRLVELFTNATIMTGVQFAGNPTYSLADDVALVSVQDEQNNFQLIGLGWSDFSVRAAALLTGVGNTLHYASEAVIGEDCNIYINVDDVLHVLEPMPLQEVVPVIECIDIRKNAYFSYQNNAGMAFQIPFVQDRNNLSPLGVAPITSFVNGSAPTTFPFSPRVSLAGYAAAQQFGWALEDYTLMFAANDQSLACPTAINLTIVFKTLSTVNVNTFPTVLKSVFATVMQINPERLTTGTLVYNGPFAKKRGSNDATVTLELEIADGNSTEPTAGEVVQDFIDNKQDELNNELQPSQPVPTYIDNIDVKTSDLPSQSGVRNPPVSPVSPVPPASGPTASTPSSVPLRSPNGSIVSSAQLVVVNSLLLLFALLV